VNNDMAAPAANAKTIAYSNFQKYQVRDVVGATMFRLNDSAYLNQGKVAFLMWARAGGNLLDSTAVKTYQHSAT
jgi:HK97 family phage major capsid protein